jgi:hypothetical protein
LRALVCSLKSLGQAVKVRPLGKDKVYWKLHPQIVGATPAGLVRKLTVEEQRTLVWRIETPFARKRAFGAYFRSIQNTSQIV